MDSNMNGIIITTNLQGKLGANEIKEEIVQHRVGESLLSRKISYLGRTESKCTRKTNISEEVANNWIKGKSPFWVKEFIWKNMSRQQRIKAYIERFDEGFGVS